MRPAAFSLLLILLAASSAAAQDRDPFQAVYDAQKLRATQAKQMERASTRIVDPTGTTPYAPTHLPGAGGGTPIEPPSNREPGEGASFWLLPAVVLAVLLGVAVVRRTRGPRKRTWSDLPGHQGLRKR